MNYKKILEDDFKEENENNPERNLTKLRYLSEKVFEFTTYDDEMDELFAKKALEVCKAINNGKTFEYIKNDYLWYLQLCNMSFFVGKLDWGTSIRGAWWDYEIKLDSVIFWSEKNKNSKMVFTQYEWKKFISAMIEFVES